MSINFEMIYCERFKCTMSKKACEVRSKNHNLTGCTGCKRCDFISSKHRTDNEQLFEAYEMFYTIDLKNNNKEFTFIERLNEHEEETKDWRDIKGFYGFEAD